MKYRWWIILLLIIASTIGAEVVYGHSDKLLGFYGIYGFAVCIVMVIVSKILGFFLKRKEDYYGQ